MDLLISTLLHIFQVDTATGNVKILRAGDGYYFGITCMGECIVTTHTGGYLRYQRGKEAVDHTSSHLIDPHQVEWIGDRVIVANTGKNCLSVFDPQGNLVRDIYLNEIRFDRKDSDRMGNHFNSVHLAGGRIFVTAHNYERHSEVWELSWPELEVVGTLQTRAGYAHNTWLGEWGLVTCDSKNGNLYEVYSGETIWKSNEPRAFPRGLAVGIDYLFVGYSAASIRKERFWTSGGIWIIDRKTLKLVEKLLLPGSGQVNEVRIIGSPDEAHNNQVITQNMLANLRYVSPVVNMAYRLRRKFPKLRRNIFLISQITRARQITSDQKRSVEIQRYQKSIGG